MTAPEVGRTHDVVVWLNDSQRLGLTLVPQTYRIRNAPTFLPQISVGDPSGIDRARWKSFIQHRFDGGAGQIFLSGTQPNNRYAESNLIDLGMPVSVVGGLAGRTAARGVALAPATEPEGLFSGAILPRATTSLTPLAGLFTKTYPVFVLEMSSRPHVINYKSMVQYAGAEAILSGGAIAGWQDPLATGYWAVLKTDAATPIRSAVRFSGIFLYAREDHGIGAYGSQDGVAAATFYQPAYNTLADRLETYDNRLWKVTGGRTAMLTLQPGNTSIPAFVWSDYKEIGDQAVDVNNTCVFGGKKYYGKADSLWVYDAGNIYPVEESFKQVRDPSNFNMMCVHKGQMYFNIRQMVYRYGVNGLFERLMTPNFDGVVQGGCSVGDELHVVVLTSTGEGEIWIYQSDTGGWRRWFTSTEFSYGSDPNNPQGIAGAGVAYGYEWILPVQASLGYSPGSPYQSAIVAANRISPARTQIVPYFAKTHSYLITSMMDLGYPDLKKIINCFNIDYGLYSTGDRIDISWLAELKGPLLIGAFLQDAASVWYDGTAELNDGSILASEGALDVTTTLYDLYLLFASPIEAMRMVVGAGHVGISGGLWSYSSAKGWNGISGAEQFYLTTEAGDKLTTEAGDYLVGTSEGMRINDSTLYLTKTGYVIPGSLTDWVPVTIQGVTGYALRYTSPTAGATRVQFTECIGITSLKKQNWQSLGSIGGAADMALVKKRLYFAIGEATVREIMVRFDVWGTDASRPEVKRLEIEYVEEPSDRAVIDFVAMAMDRIETIEAGPDGRFVVENSGQWIGATLWSMSRAPRLFVAAIPWPVVGETLRARVSITDPGTLVPVLAYGHSWTGADVPIRLDQM